MTKVSRLGLGLFSLAVISLLAVFKLEFSAIAPAQSQTASKQPNTAAAVPPDSVNVLPSTEVSKPIQTEYPVGTNPSVIDPQLRFNNEGFVYDPNSKRDPFKPYLKPIEVFKDQKLAAPAPGKKVDPEKPYQSADMLFKGDGKVGSGENLTNIDVEKLKLVGILWNVKEPKAMLSSGSKVYLVKRRTKVGIRSGYIAAIREGEVVIIELSQDGRSPNTHVLTIQK